MLRFGRSRPGCALWPLTDDLCAVGRQGAINGVTTALDAHTGVAAGARTSGPAAISASRACTIRLTLHASALR